MREYPVMYEINSNTKSEISQPKGVKTTKRLDVTLTGV